MKKIVVEIDDLTGEVTISTEGFKGPECMKASEFIEKALGETKEVKKTAEYYQKEVKQTKKIKRG